MKFSIITPSYNQVEFIPETIESILTQKGNFKIEYFVMDGGSTDGTVKVLKNYEKKIKAGKFEKYNKGIKFCYVSEKDKGQSDAINKGLKKTTGDIIAYLNSDDTYQPEAFRKVTEAFRKNKAAKWLTGFCRIIDEKGQTIQGPITKYKNFWLKRFKARNLMILNFISQPATFWRQELMREIGCFDEKLHFTMDYDYWLRALKISKPIVIKDFLSNFRIHSSSKGKVDFIKQFEQDLATCKKHTDRKTLIYLHKLHNSLIKSAYRVIK